LQLLQGVQFFDGRSHKCILIAGIVPEGRCCALVVEVLALDFLNLPIRP
jgi:hypothetical protein